MTRLLSRRALIGGTGKGAASLLTTGLLTTGLLTGCDRIGASAIGQSLLDCGEGCNFNSHRFLVDRAALAKEFTPQQRSPIFRANGTQMPQGRDYARHMANNFVDWRLTIEGLVTQPQSFSLAELRAAPARTQITRHDCVEGWSAIGQWTGVPVKLLLDRVGLMPSARFLVFHCADAMGNGTQYYESIDLVDALHPQTILAWALNDTVLPIPNGAPLRLRVERQLGYKHAKYVERIEAVASLARIYGGKGGYWEDVGDYEWYAGA
jgi:DMSO/TMAO reductase YedYZ molybdopterin-dependent catalytic subunit